MDGYAPAYVAHNVPLLVVSGLGSGQYDTKLAAPGTVIVSELPAVETEDALKLLEHFKKRDAVGLPWNADEHIGRNKFKIKVIGRVAKSSAFYLPSVTELNRSMLYHPASLNRMRRLHEHSILEM